MSIFLDIETIPAWDSYDEMPEGFKKHWDKQYTKFAPASQDPQDALGAAGLSAEFGRVLCVSMGREIGDCFTVRSVIDHDERSLLLSVYHFLEKHPSNIIGHNIKKFDGPFLFRRYVANGLPVPSSLVPASKPWFSKLVDTVELWGAGVWNYQCSLDLLCHILDIPTPKDSCDGSQVWSMYQMMQLEEIERYCEKDVQACYTAWCRLTNRSPLPFEQDCIDL